MSIVLMRDYSRNPSLQLLFKVPRLPIGCIAQCVCIGYVIMLTLAMNDRMGVATEETQLTLD